MIKYAYFKQSKIRFSDKGRGRVIVLIHGFLGSLDVWQEFSEKLSKRFRVIAIDLPGHGESPSIGYVHQMEMMAECVKKILSHLKIKALRFSRPFHGRISLPLLLQNYFLKMFLHFAFSTPLPYTIQPKKKVGRSRAIEAVKKNHQQFTYEFIPQLFAPENTARLTNEIEHAQSIASKMTRQGIVNALEGMKERTSKEHILKTAYYPILFIARKNIESPYKK